MAGDYTVEPLAKQERGVTLRVITESSANLVDRKGKIGEADAGSLGSPRQSRYSVVKEQKDSEWQATSAASGNIIVTVRVKEVEQVYCGQHGSITYADLTQSAPAFVAVSQQEVEHVNSLVAAMVR